STAESVLASLAVAFSSAADNPVRSRNRRSLDSSEARNVRAFKAMISASSTVTFGRRGCMSVDPDSWRQLVPLHLKLLVTCFRHTLCPQQVRRIDATSRLGWEQAGQDHELSGRKRGVQRPATAC